MDSEPISHRLLSQRHRELSRKFHHLARNNHASESMKATLLRTGRANSWISYAEGEPARPDVVFVFLWIAFNALYGRPESLGVDRTSEGWYFDKYLDDVVSLDTHSRIERVLATQWRHVEGILYNPFVSGAFWSRYRERGYFDEGRFVIETRQELAGAGTAGKLKLVLDRMYVLRNQVFHGSTTSIARGTTGRQQVVQGSSIMRHLVPLLSLLTMENCEHGWEPPDFPGNPLKHDGSWKEEIEGVGWREV